MMLTFLVPFVSCTRELACEDVAGVPDGVPVRFSAAPETSPATRTAVSAGGDGLLDIVWSTDDAIGIYGLVEGRPSGSNIQYLATPGDDASTCTLSAANSSEIFTWRSNVAQGYYAYWPYSDSEGVNWDAESHPVSLPSGQVQASGNSPAHIADYMFMTAMKEFSAEEATGGNVQYVFRNVFSVVEFRLKMDAMLSIDEVPVKSARLVSTAADLAWTEASVDLTREFVAGAEMPVSVVSGSREVLLDITENASLVKDGWTSLYFVVAPQTHAAGSLTLELTAIDNSVYTLAIPEGVSFLPNRHYVREYELSFDGFVQADRFDVDIPVLTVNAGEPLVIQTSGSAETVGIWTGEEGHDYEYSDKDRMQEPEMTMSFKMNLQSGVQRHPARIMYSHDFNGNMTEDDVLAATWTDVSEGFDFTTFIYGVDLDEDGKTSENVGDGTAPHDAGVVDCTDWFSEEDGTCRIAVFYHIDAYDENYVDDLTGTTGNGRTYFYIYDMWVRAQYKSEETFTEVYRHKWSENEAERDETYPLFVQGANFDSSDGTNPFRTFNWGQYPMVVRMGSAFRPTEDRNSYFVLPELTMPEAKNVGKDTPVMLKDADDGMQSQYTYTFDSPGTYRVVIVGTVMTLAGETYVTKEFEVTVNE